MTTTPRHYPGMFPLSGVEFFNHEHEEYVIENGHTKPFESLSSYTLQLLQRSIDSTPEVKAELLDMHPECEMSRVKQFAKCRFGGLDYHADVINGTLQPGEFWACPLHGSCKSEGILCKLPNYNGSVLTKHDVKLIQLLSSEATNEVIAQEMNLAAGTFHRDKNLLYKKLGNIQTKQEVARIAIFLNLI